MRFLDIEFEQFMRFESLRFEFEGQTTGVFGRNGSGKSSFLTGWYFLLTGDVSRFRRNKKDLISQNAPPGAKSFVRGTFEHRGRKFRITRSLRPDKTTLVIDEDHENPITGEAATERMLAELGTTKELLKTCTFIDQGEIFAFLSMTPAKRHESFAKLCRLTRFAEMAQALGRFRTQLDVRLRGSEGDAVELTTRIARLEATQEEQTKLKAAAERKFKSAEKLRAAETTIVSSNRLSALTTERDRLVEEQNRGGARYGELMNQRTSLESRLGNVQGLLDSQRSALAALEIAQERATRASNRLVVGSKLRDLQSRTASLSTKTGGIEEDAVEYQQLSDDIAALGAELFGLEGLINLAGDVCPTCRRPVGAEERADARTRAQPLQLQRSGKIADRDRLGASLHERKSAASELLVLRGRLEAADAEYAQLGGVNAEIDLQQSEDTRRDANESREAVAAIERSLTSARQAESAVAGIDAEIGALNRRNNEGIIPRLEELRGEIEGLKITDKKLEDARALLAAHRAAETEAATADGYLRGVSAELQSSRERLEQIRERSKLFAELAEQRNVVDTLATAFDWRKVPQAVASQQLKLIVESMQEQLEIFGSPFEVTAGESLDLYAAFPGEPPIEAEALSAGQRTVLCLPLCKAIADLTAGSVGVLALDEPTSALDGENVRYLAEYLSQLRDRERSLQVLVSTHVEELRYAFDSTLRIGTTEDAEQTAA